MKSSGGKSQRREEKKKEDSKEKAPEERKSRCARSSKFAKHFVFPMILWLRSRKVGSLKRRVRSQLARWGMKNCTHQGILAVWAGGLIQWESKRQSFATLSSSEAEVTSYVDAMCLGDSVAVLVDIFKEVRLTEKGVRVLYGDSQSGIQVALNPNGPWRSRHLSFRLRALHEAAQQEVWKVKHMAGVEFAQISWQNRSRWELHGQDSGGPGHLEEDWDL